MVGLRYEICEAPGVGSTTSWQDRVKIRDAQPASGSFTDYRRQVGRGQVTLENDYPRLSEIIDVDPDDHSNDVASTVVVYRPAQGPYPETLVAEWLVNQTPDELSESELVLNGPGMGAVMDWAIVEPWDWDGTDDFVSRFPDHIYGGRNVLVPIGESQCEPRISEFWTDATSGQWRVDVDGDTVDIDYNATASQVTTAYESLSTVTDVIVEGNGSEETPWRVTFVEPCYPTTSYTVTQNTLNAPINAGLIQLGGDVPPGWTEARPLAGNTLYGEYADFGVGTLPTPAPDGSTTGIFFDGETPIGFSFPGVQTVPSVKPGGQYQAGVYVYVDAAGSYPMRMVMRAPSEEPLVADSGWPSTSVTGQTWTLLSAADVSIPDYLDRVIFRTSYVGTANPPRIYVAGAYLREGMAAATAGQIMLDLLADAQTDHAGRDAIDFIDADFDATNDSSGTAWPGVESVNIQRGQPYKRVLDSVLGRLGYEWDVVRSSTAGRWDLKLWGPGTRTTDYSAADSPSLLLGQDTLSGAASTALPRANAVTVEGAGQVFAHDEDAGSITAISRREAYQGDITYVENLDDWAGEVLDRFLDEAYAPRFEVADGSGPVPGVAYGLADALTVTTHRRRVTRQVESRGFTDTVQGGLRWTVQFGEAQFDGPVSSGGGSSSVVSRGAGLGAIGPVAEGVRRLLEQQDRLLAFESPSSVSVGAGGGAPTVVVAASNATELSKSKADFICNGGNDEVVIRQAWDSLSPVSGALRAGRVLLTEGTFYINVEGDGLDFESISTSGIHLQGMGIGATVLEQVAPRSAAVTFQAQILSITSNATVSDLTIDAKTTGVGIYHIYVGGAVNVVIRDVEFIGGTAGAIYSEAAIVNVDGCLSTSAGAWFITQVGGSHLNVTNCYMDCDGGVSVVGSDVVEIRACEIYAASNQGVSFDTTGEAWVSDCVVYSEETVILGDGATAVHIDGCVLVNDDFVEAVVELGTGGGTQFLTWITNNYMFGGGTAGILVGDLDGTLERCVISGNHVGDVGEDGIVVVGAFQTIITDNTVERTAINTGGGDGIRVDTGVGVVVSNNNLSSIFDAYGIHLVTSSDCTVVGNTMQRVGRHGVWIEADSCIVASNMIRWAGSNTPGDEYDGIHVAGDANDVRDNHVATNGASTSNARYGINVASGTGNSYLGNRAAGTFETASFVDNGTSTVNTWPGAAAPQGDNLT